MHLSYSRLFKPTFIYHSFCNDGRSCPGIPNGSEKMWLLDINTSSSDSHLVCENVSQALAICGERVMLHLICPQTR